MQVQIGTQKVAADGGGRVSDLGNQAPEDVADRPARLLRPEPWAVERTSQRPSSHLAVTDISYLSHRERDEWVDARIDASGTPGLFEGHAGAAERELAENAQRVTAINVADPALTNAHRLLEGA